MSDLAELARCYGVQMFFRGLGGQRYTAPPEVLLEVLRALGAPLETFRDVPSALRAWHEERARRLLQPVVVAWEGQASNIDLSLPSALADRPVWCTLLTEQGEEHSWEASCSSDIEVEGTDRAGTRYERRRFPIPFLLPPGYHRLRVEGAGSEAEALVISAPRKAWAFAPLPLGEAGRRAEGPRADEGLHSGGAGHSRLWGAFVPLYSLHTRRSAGAGDLGDLDRLAQWVAHLGGRAVATTPLLAAFLDERLDPSPYGPVSRLFWNDLYVDLNQVPELRGSPLGRAVAATPAFAQELAALQAAPLVDYAGVARLKRRALEPLAQEFLREPSERRNAFHRFREATPELERYARFRAVHEQQGRPWLDWPERLRRGAVEPGDYNEGTYQYHQYVQWLAHEQLEALSRRSRSRGVQLSFDLPIGARLDGFDVWSQQTLFARGVSVGAPPDPGFPTGQVWGFPPVRPEESRVQEHRYFIQSVRHQLRHAAMLRVDHVMGLHRLYWVPQGAEPRDGVYVTYPHEEYYAILSLESLRHQAVIVGEDLGTVPRSVRSTMRRHGLQRLYVLQMELVAPGGRQLGKPPAASVASLNTHDMPPFAGFWYEEGPAGPIRESRRALWHRLVAALMDRGVLHDDHPDPRALLAGSLDLLGASRAGLVLLNMEDLWFETEPQNIPGEQNASNWRRKLRYSLEALEGLPELLDPLQGLMARRSGH